MSNIVVLKFGSSVLRSAADLPAAVDEIYRHVRAGRRVVAVVSVITSYSIHYTKLYDAIASL